MSDTRRAASVWPEMPFMRGPVAAQRLAELVPVLKRNRAACEERRAAVLRHEWARKRLCNIFGYQDARQWGGYVPPAHAPDGALNTVASRRLLLGLLDEVAEHERELRAVGGAA